MISGCDLDLRGEKHSNPKFVKFYLGKSSNVNLFNIFDDKVETPTCRLFESIYKDFSWSEFKVKVKKARKILETITTKFDFLSRLYPKLLLLFFILQHKLLLTLQKSHTQSQNTYRDWDDMKSVQKRGRLLWVRLLFLLFFPFCKLLSLWVILLIFPNKYCNIFDDQTKRRLHLKTEPL